MSSIDDLKARRRWMYARHDHTNKYVSEEFCQGLENFMRFAKSQPLFLENKTLFCPCLKCENGKQLEERTVESHLFNRGFMPNYWVWISHGEDYSILNNHCEEDCLNHPTEDEFASSSPVEAANPYVTMISDAFNRESENMEEEPNVEAKKFYDFLDAAKQPLYDGCKEGLSQLSLAARLMSLKTDYNLSQNCMDSVAQLLKEYLPEGNKSMKSYYEIKKLMRSLGLPYQKIDVCQDICMLFWKDGASEESCRFCKKDRYLPIKKPGQKRIAYRQMFYLPLADRLKRLYQSHHTSKDMRWHAEHSSNSGEMCHPSDGEAWKHFLDVHPSFASEPRNVFLGLCTDGFNPFVPGPKHPKRSLDIFLQPLIEELKELWANGVQAYDISTKQNFVLRAVLMWTISDFPAYGMLSGWTTHGRLACPYCMDETDAFQLKKGRKTSWFDCHRCFLPTDHSYRRNKKNFRRGRVVNHNPPPILTGDELLNEIKRLPKSVDCGGNHGQIIGYGDTHNFHKQSIFWELPYWKDHKLQFNLDVMHTEKNFVDNIFNTLLNVPGKTKDNMNSRIDVEEHCNRKELHLVVARNGVDRKAPVPVFRLDSDGKISFSKWLENDVKFSDGYASSLSNCVDLSQGKLTGLKSHVCHVLMQRLLPIAFAKLMEKSLHEALSGISLFFRDLCRRTLHKDGVKMTHKNICMVICNLEKIFPPSFFDVMEHLPIHLPHEAILGGPVQFRWMYPFERYMGHLKRKVKNKAKVEGSIVEQYINEEISNFTTYYFEKHIKTKSRAGDRHYDGRNEEDTHKFSKIPDIFVHPGRGSGKEREIWLQDKDLHIANTYVLLNCEQLRPFERLFDESMEVSYPGISGDNLIELKEKTFATWLEKHVEDTQDHNSYPDWVQTLAHGPMTKVTCWPIYFCRGYIFHTYYHGKEKKSANYGVCVKGITSCGLSDEPDFYGVLREIFELHYPGPVHLKVVLFKCDWYDSTTRMGTRVNKSGIIDVNIGKRYGKYDPFILASQADQVCYVPYPLKKHKRNHPWKATIVIPPREKVLVNQNFDFTAMQHENDDPILNVDLLHVETLADLHGQEEDLDDNVEEQNFDSDDEDGNFDIELNIDESE